MIEDNGAHDEAAQDILDLRTRAERLERELADVKAAADARVIRSELRAEAARAGIVDLDGIKLIDTSGLSLSADGDVEGVVAAVSQLKKVKPWLFGGGSSSNPAAVPPTGAVAAKQAMEMTDAEYTVARAALLRDRM